MVNVNVQDARSANITKYLNKIVQDHIDSIPWTTPSYTLGSESMANTLTAWNKYSVVMRDQFEFHKTLGDNNGFKIGLPYGLSASVDLRGDAFPNDWAPPAVIDNLSLSDLVTGLAGPDKARFNKFRKSLKKLYKTNDIYVKKTTNYGPTNEWASVNPLTYVSGNLNTSSEWHAVAVFGADIHENAVRNQETLLNSLEKLWNKFAAPYLGTANDQKEQQDEENFNDFLDKNPSVSEIFDGVLVIKDPTIIIPSDVLKNNDISVYFIPQAEDINNPKGVITNTSIGSRFNPPPHFSTISKPPTAFPDDTPRDSNKNRYIDNGTTTIDNSSAFSKDYRKNQRLYSNRLGFMYQDALNNNKISVKSGIAPSIQNLWGFQFMYNPGSLSYSVSSDPNLDWTQYGKPEGDVSNILFGQTNFQFSLMINRIPDIGLLRSLYTRNETSGIPVETGTRNGYPRPLTEREVIGILTRGTEYDLEFLFRTLNGDPKVNPVMESGQKTANYGIIMGIPIWIRFHDNMRVKGIVSNLQVNHVMFTPNMVPVLTEVSVSFSRIPVIFDGNVKELYKKLDKTVAATEEE